MSLQIGRIEFGIPSGVLPTALPMLERLTEQPKVNEAAKRNDPHKRAIRLALFEIDRDYIAARYPDLLNALEAAIEEGVKVVVIKLWVEMISTNPALVKQVGNVAELLEWQKAQREASEHGGTVVFDRRELRWTVVQEVNEEC